MLQYVKAFIGGALAGLASLQAALPDGVTQAEWVAVAVATLAAGGAVFGVPNATPAPAMDLEDGPQDDEA